MGTIAEEISALQGRISAAYQQLARMGGQQPVKEDTWHLAEAISTIPTSKYGVPLDGVLGDGDDMGYGILQQPTEEYALSTD